MTVLRSLVVSRLVVGLALAGLIVPLVPAAEAEDEVRLIEVLGHAEAVQKALNAAQLAADPLGAFVEAYALATGLDPDDVRARLEGDALWLATEWPAPQAVLVVSSPAAITGGRALPVAVVREAEQVASVTQSIVALPDSPCLGASVEVAARGARGP